MEFGKLLYMQMQRRRSVGNPHTVQREEAIGWKLFPVRGFTEIRAGALRMKDE